MCPRRVALNLLLGCLLLIHANAAASHAEYGYVPALGYGEVTDAMHRLLHFALDLLTAGRLDEIVDREYIYNLEWYEGLPSVLSGNGST